MAVETNLASLQQRSARARASRQDALPFSARGSPGELSPRETRRSVAGPPPSVGPTEEARRGGRWHAPAHVAHLVASHVLAVHRRPGSWPQKSRIRHLAVFPPWWHGALAWTLEEAQCLCRTSSGQTRSPSLGAREREWGALHEALGASHRAHRGKHWDALSGHMVGGGGAMLARMAATGWFAGWWSACELSFVQRACAFI